MPSVKALVGDARSFLVRLVQSNHRQLSVDLLLCSQNASVVLQASRCLPPFPDSRHTRPMHDSPSGRRKRAARAPPSPSSGRRRGAWAACPAPTVLDTSNAHGPRLLRMRCSATRRSHPRYAPELGCARIAMAKALGGSVTNMPMKGPGSALPWASSIGAAWQFQALLAVDTLPIHQAPDQLTA